MSLASGTKLGPYEIVAPLGAGGMGEVYRARDTRLGRDVALKVLPDVFAQDPERMARFEREAQVLASLNHPNIAALYGLEDRALVMELVEGPTLAERIAQGPLPLDEALPIARQIAQALEEAHEKGIIHRDLKPSNAKVTPGGAVKVLDFGLAKALEDDRAAASISNSPTLSLAATRAGVILGTAAYMPPEQVRGAAADRRADIWAFGVVLYEMLAGKQAFAGDSVSDVLASVLKFDPDWSALPAETPAAIRKLVRQCLAKDRKQRLQAIGDARLAIEEALQGAATEEPVPPRLSVSQSRGRAILWMLAALVIALSFVAYFRRPAPDVRAIKLALLPPERTAFGPIEVSPDGRRLAFVATESGKTQLWIRSLDSLTAQPLAGTDGAAFPFWSPDSRFVGFFAQGKLKKIEASGGPPQTVCDVVTGVGGAWNRDGVIVFAPSTARPLYRVQAAGGAAQPLTDLDPSRQESGHRWPYFLPDGRHYVYLVRSAQSDHRGIYLGALDSKERRRLLGDQSNAAYADGQLLFVRDGTLMAQPFDPNKLQLSGEPFPVAEQAGYDASFTRGTFSVSENGVLVYDPSGSSQSDELVWFDRAGKRLSSVGAPGRHLQPWLSPDEKMVAVDQNDPQTSTDIWLIDLARDIPSRFTFGPGNLLPVWSPDGRRIAFMSNRAGPFNLYQKISTGAGKDELLQKSPNIQRPTDWSRDGRFLAYDENDPKTRFDLWVLPLAGDRKPIPFLQTEFNEQWGHFSPDGRWMAYVSDESTRDEVYVQSFPASGGKWLISKNGGSYPKWRRDGKELFYLAADKKIMAVEVNTSSTFEAGTPKPLFETHISFVYTRFAVTADGQRFLVPTPTGEVKSLPATVIVNWTAGIKR